MVKKLLVIGLPLALLVVGCSGKDQPTATAPVGAKTAAATNAPPGQKGGSAHGVSAANMIVGGGQSHVGSKAH